MPSFCEATQQTEAVAATSKACRCKSEKFLESYLDPSLLVFDVPVIAPAEDKTDEVLENARKLIQQVGRQLSDVKNNENLVRLLHEAPYTSTTQFENSDDSRLYVKHLVNTKMQELLMNQKPQELLSTCSLGADTGRKHLLGEKKNRNVQVKNATKVQQNYFQEVTSQSKFHTQKRAIHSEEIIHKTKHVNVGSRSRILGSDNCGNRKQLDVQSNLSDKNPDVKKMPKGNFVSEKVSVHKKHVATIGENRGVKITNVQKNKFGSTSTNLSTETTNTKIRQRVRNSKLEVVNKSATKEEECPCPICSYEKQHKETSTCKKYPNLQADMVQRYAENDIKELAINKQQSHKNERENSSIRTSSLRNVSKDYPAKVAGRVKAKISSEDVNKRNFTRQVQARVHQAKQLGASSDTAESRKSLIETTNYSSEMGDRSQSSGTCEPKEENWANVLNTGSSLSIMQTLLSLFSENTKKKEQTCLQQAEKQNVVSCPVHGTQSRSDTGTPAAPRGEPTFKARTAEKLQKEVTFQEVSKVSTHICLHCGKVKKNFALQKKKTGQNSCYKVQCRGNSESVASSLSTGSVDNEGKMILLKKLVTAAKQGGSMVFTKNSEQLNSQEELEQKMTTQPVATRSLEYGVSEWMEPSAKLQAGKEDNCGRPAMLVLTSEEGPQVSSSAEDAEPLHSSLPCANPLQASQIEEIMKMLEDIDCGNLSVGRTPEDAEPSQMQQQQANEMVQQHNYEMQEDGENAKKDEEAVDVEYDDDWEEEPEEEGEKDKETGCTIDGSSDASDAGKGCRSEQSAPSIAAPDGKSGSSSDSEGLSSKHHSSDKDSSSSQQVAAADAESVHLEPPTTSPLDLVTSEGSSAAVLTQQTFSVYNTKENPTSEMCASSHTTFLTASHLHPISAPCISLPITDTGTDDPYVTAENKMYQPGDISKLIPPSTTSTMANGSSKFSRVFLTHENPFNNPVVCNNPVVYDSGTQTKETTLPLYPSVNPQVTGLGSTAESAFSQVLPPNLHVPNMTSYIPVHGQIPPATFFMPLHQMPYFIAPMPVQNQPVHFPDRTTPQQQSSNIFEATRMDDAARRTTYVTTSTSLHSQDLDSECGQLTAQRSTISPPNVHSQTKYVERPSETAHSVLENPFSQLTTHSSMLPLAINSTYSCSENVGNSHESQASISRNSNNIKHSTNKGVQASLQSLQVKGVQVSDISDEIRNFKEKVRSSSSTAIPAWRHKEGFRRQIVPSPIVEAASENTSTSDESLSAHKEKLPSSTLSELIESSTDTDVTPSCSDLSEGEVHLSSEGVMRLSPTTRSSPGEVSQCDCSEGEVCPHKHQVYQGQSLSAGELLPRKSLGRPTVATAFSSSVSEATQYSSIPEMQSSSLSSSCDIAFDSSDMLHEHTW